jgi:hypothetical protein
VPGETVPGYAGIVARDDRSERLFELCEACGRAVKVIASIEDPAVIKQILAYLKRKVESKELNPLPESRAPPQGSLFG